MISFDENSPITQPISKSELQERIFYAQEKKSTGMAKISFQTGEEMLLLFRGGDIRQIYFKKENGFKRISGPWDEYLQPGSLVRFDIQLMPANRLFFEKVVLEIQDREKEKRPAFQSSGLAGLFLSMANREAASLIHIHWQNAEAFVLVPGSNIPQRQAVFVSENGTEENSAALSRIQTYPDSNCDLTIYSGEHESEAWQELHLKILFEWFCSNLLTGYGYLTGKVMVTPVVQNLMIFSSQSGWEVNWIGGEVVDQTIFSSPAMAGDAYREMLALVSEHMSAVVGLTLVQTIQQQGLVSVNLFYQSVIKAYELIQ
jgi:hypothetical protein